MGADRCDNVLSPERSFTNICWFCGSGWEVVEAVEAIEEERDDRIFSGRTLVGAT